MATASDNDALENLDTRTVTFDNLHVNLDGVTGTESRDVFAQRSCIDGVQLLHVYSLTLLPQVSHVSSAGQACDREYVRMIRRPPAAGYATHRPFKFATFFEEKNSAKRKNLPEKR